MIDISIAAKEYRLGYLDLYEAARLAGVMPEQILDYLTGFTATTYSDIDSELIIHRDKYDFG